MKKNIKIKTQKFKRWENKKYSIFKSIGKQINIGFLLASYLIVSNINLINAQNDTIKINEIKIETMQVPMSYSETSRIINIISKKQIEQAPVNNIQDLLEYAANIDVRQRGNNGVQSDVSIRGGSFDQILILLNGFKINDTQSGHHNLNIPISINDIERIEILEGAGAKEYGTNAFSGAINIITKKTKSKQINAELSTGENNFYNGYFSISHYHKKTKQYLSLEKKYCEGYIDNTDFNINNIFYNLNYNQKKYRLDFQTGYNDKAFGANSFYTPKYPNQFEHTRTLFSGLKFKTGQKIKYTQSIYLRKNLDKFELFRTNPASWYTHHNYHLTSTYGLNSKITFSSILGKTAVGIDADIENIYSNVLGENLNDTLNVPFEPDGFFTKYKSRNNLNIFINNNKTIQNFTTSVGLLININSDFGINYAPGINFSYNLTKKIKTIASYNWAVRLPTFTDLYYVGPTNIGNPFLTPEKSRTHEAGLKYNHKFLSATATIFHRNGTNLIDWVRKNDTLLWESKNITSLNTNGFEFAGTLRFDKLFPKNIFIKNITIKYNYIQSDKQSYNYISKYALDYLKQKINIITNYTIYKNISASLYINYQERNGTYTDFLTGNETKYKPFTLIDAQINFTKTKYKIYIKVNNLTNVEYFDIANIPMPKRWFFIGGKIFLHYK